MMTKGDEWKARAARWFCISLGVLGGYLFLRYALLILLPFLVAWGVAIIVYPLSVKSAKKFHLPQKLLAVVYVLVFLGLLGVGIWWGVGRLLSEVEGLLARLSESGNDFSATIDGIWGQVMGFLHRLPFLSQMEQGEVGEAVSGLLLQVLSSLGQSVGNAAGAILAAMPNLIFGVIVTLLGCLYLSADYEGIRDRLLGLLPSGAQQKVAKARLRAKRVGRGYGRAYLILFGLTFVELFIGLLILKIPYAFLISLWIAAIDILPMIGSGAILVPWAIFSFLGKEPQTALGILILFGVISIVRQIAEPHLLGSSLGVHPLLSLFCVFVGCQILGFWGFLLGPVVALVLQELFRGEEISQKT